MGGSGAVAQRIAELDEIVVIDSIQKPLSSGFAYRFDSLAYLGTNRHDNLATLISSQTAVYIKSGGPGLLATPTFRGGDANHTSVVWNGMKINSPMLGSIDFNTINVGSFDKVEVVTGTSSNVYGSGGLGGAICLSNTPSFRTAYSEVSMQLGSFDNSDFTVGLNTPFKIANVPFTISVNGQRNRMKNEFSYLNNRSNPNQLEVMRNAEFSMDNMLYSIAAQPSQRLMITLNYWNTNTDRSIPNPLGINKLHVANQSDTTHRYQIGLDWYPTERLTIKQFFFYEKNINYYQDSNINLINSNSYYSVQAFSAFNYKLHKKVDLNLQLNNTWTEAKSGNFKGYQHQFLSSGVLAIAMRPIHRMNVDIGVRTEAVLQRIQLLPYAGTSLKLFQSSDIHMIGSIARTARFPTLNEQFWQPGGNTNLKPETGLTAEAGFKGKLRSLEFKSVFFSTSYENRIRWIANGSIYSPTNISQSQVMGVDLHIGWERKFQEWKVKLASAVNYTNAQGRLDGQSQYYALSFVPNWTSSVNGTLSYRAMSFSIHSSYIGKRYITNDETALMPSFLLTNAMLRWKQADGPLSIHIGSNNSFDRNYQNLPWRPMPGRSFLIGLTITSK